MSFEPGSDQHNDLWGEKDDFCNFQFFMYFKSQSGLLYSIIMAIDNLYTISEGEGLNEKICQVLKRRLAFNKCYLNVFF